MVNVNDIRNKYWELLESPIPSTFDIHAKIPLDELKANIKIMEKARDFKDCGCFGILCTECRFAYIGNECKIPTLIDTQKEKLIQYLKENDLLKS